MYNNSKIVKHLILFFLSSFFSIITFLYVGINYHKKKDTTAKDIPFFIMPIMMPTLYGLVGILNYYAIRRFGNEASLFVGGAFGLALSFFGRFAIDAPKKVLNFTDENENMVHAVAPLAYGLIFRLLVTPATNYIVPR
jgi:hypothetical protein